MHEYMFHTLIRLWNYRYYFLGLWCSSK